MKEIGGSTAAMSVTPADAFDPARGGTRRHDETDSRAAGGQTSRPPIACAAIGLNHGHIYSQVETVLRNGGELTAVYAKEPELLAAFTKRYPQARVAHSEQEILEDRAIQLVVSAAIPDERAPLGIRVMQHGKDFMADKPGITTLAQLAEVRRVQARTGRIYAILYGERLENPATVRAAELVKGGAIGRIVQTIGVGPHRLNATSRPAWFWEKARYGGILCDLGSHQADQYLHFTGSTRADVVAAQAGNLHHQQSPGLEDFGDAVLRGNGGAGYFRVDWFTPDGLSTYGDARLTVIGTDGYIEVRKNVDLSGRPGGSHLFLVDHKDTRYIDCRDTPLPYGAQFMADVANRTETAMTQAHGFLATELVLEAQARAQTPGLQA